MAHATGAPEALQAVRATAQAEFVDKVSPGEHAGGQWSHRRSVERATVRGAKQVNAFKIFRPLKMTRAPPERAG